MKASIIIRAYNNEHTIQRAVQSALNQDFSEELFEVIVVNDGSNDSTAKVLQDFEAPRLAIIAQANKGAVAAANVGFRAARGKFVVLLDGDDYCKPVLLKKLTGILDKHREFVFAYSNYYEEFGGEKKIVVPRNIFETIAGGVMFRKKNLQEAGFYRADVFFAEYDLLLRTKDQWKGMHCPKILFTYSRRPDSVTANTAQVRQGIKELEALHEDKLDDIQKIRSYSYLLILRTARKDDVMLYFSLRNDLHVRAQSFDEREVLYADHKRWFAQKLADPSSYMFVALLNDTPIGQIRFDISKLTAESDISILSQCRGRGYGSYMINSACARLFQAKPALKRIFAHVKEDNTASRRSFAKAGFMERGVVNYRGHNCSEMVLTRT